MESSGAVVYGVNPFSAESHAKFARKLKLPYPLIVDRGGRIASKFGLGFWLVVRRAVCIIDAGGRVAWLRLGQPSPDEILQAVRGCTPNQKP